VSRVRSHCRFRNRGTEYVSEYGVKRVGGDKATKRRGDSATMRARRRALVQARVLDIEARWLVGGGDLGGPVDAQCRIVAGRSVALSQVALSQVALPLQKQRHRFYSCIQC
jgi:hypothetical protein